MKKLLLLFATFTLLFISCEEEENTNDENNTTSNEIIGTWTWTTSKTEKVVDGESEIIDIWELSTCDMEDSYKFDTSGNMEVKEYGGSEICGVIYSYINRYEIIDNKIIIEEYDEYDNEWWSYFYTYSVDGNVITLIYTEETDDGIIYNEIDTYTKQ